MMFARAAALSLLVWSGSAHSQVYLEGSARCVDWAFSRKQEIAIDLQHLVLGMLNGMALTTNRDFWRANNTPISQHEVYAWMDGYCESHPQDAIIAGVYRLFRERTGWQPPPGRG